MLNRFPTLEEVRSCLNTVLPELPEDPTANLFATKAIDSLRLIDTVVHLEKHYSLQFNTDYLTVENFETLEKIHSVVLKLLDQGKS